MDIFLGVRHQEESVSRTIDQPQSSAAERLISGDGLRKRQLGTGGTLRNEKVHYAANGSVTKIDTSRGWFKAQLDLVEDVHQMKVVTNSHGSRGEEISSCFHTKKDMFIVYLLSAAFAMMSDSFINSYASGVVTLHCSTRIIGIIAIIPIQLQFLHWHCVETAEQSLCYPVSLR